MCAPSRQGIPAIGIQNRRATYGMTRYLLELGHREFAVIANTGMPNDRSQARLDGILEAIAEEGIRLPTDRIFEAAQPTIVAGREAFRQLRAAHPGVTAFLCTTDAMAVGALAEARREGIRVPEDISITGFDDVEIAGETDPPLTTVRVPRGRDRHTRRPDHLISLIEGGPIPMSTQLEAALVIRGSTGPVAAPVLRKRRSRAARRLRVRPRLWTYALSAPVLRALLSAVLNRFGESLRLPGRRDGAGQRRGGLSRPRRSPVPP